MRDGICLYTAIYEPLQRTQKAPILMTRTPYKASPYGKKFNNRLWKVCQNAHLLFFTHKAPTFTSWGFVIT
ncbi:CocE/NonD family hydrolase [Bacteroides stercoris ATCC 43183]|nr:CocE/NonD family hydrolase [Bacteroides stercoris ATCC 43183]